MIAATLMRMDGPPTRDEIRDLVVRWLVLAEGGTNGMGDCQAVGKALLEAYNAIEHDDDPDEPVPIITGDELYRTLFKAFCSTWKNRIIRELKSRGDAFDHITDDYVRDGESFPGHWVESVDISDVGMTRKMAREVGQHWGSNTAADGIAMWRMHDEHEATRKKA
jgi:hypothetical protein